MELLPTSQYAGAVGTTNIRTIMVPQSVIIIVNTPTVTNHVFDKGTQSTGSYQVPAFTFQGGCTEALTYTY